MEDNDGDVDEDESLYGDSDSGYWSDNDESSSETQSPVILKRKNGRRTTRSVLLSNHQD